MKRYIFIMVIALINTLNAEEYLYPVASFQKDDQSYIYLLYQKSLRHLELWQWDPINKAGQKALLSSFTPAGLRMLPDGSGFSFIDNGRIRIKSFEKRSPKSLDICEPLYDIGVPHWIDNQYCYFSAKENERSAIYELSMQGELHKIIGSSSYDCLYPQKIGDHLFYIERAIASEGHRYKIMRIDYPKILHDTFDFNSQKDFDERVQALLKRQETEKKRLEEVVQKDLIADFHDQSIAFLDMSNENEGFIAEHPNMVDKHDKTMILNYYRIEKKGDSWQTLYLFSCEIPLHFLLSQSISRLYESILPLLPRHIGNKIYYVDCGQSQHHNLNLYAYDLESGTIQIITQATDVDQHYFTPLPINDTMFYGGTIEMEKIADNQTWLPTMGINEDGELSFDLPSVKISI